jgi:hypothetical protein
LSNKPWASAALAKPTAITKIAGKYAVCITVFSSSLARLRRGSVLMGVSNPALAADATDAIANSCQLLRLLRIGFEEVLRGGLPLEQIAYCSSGAL